MTTILILVDGKAALTVEQAAQRYGLACSSVRAALSRLDVEPDAKLDGRKGLYLTERLDALMADRPGRGVSLRGHG